MFGFILVQICKNWLLKAYFKSVDQNLQLKFLENTREWSRRIDLPRDLIVICKHFLTLQLFLHEDIAHEESTFQESTVS